MLFRSYQRLGFSKYDREAKFVEIPEKIDKVVVPMDSHIGKPATPAVQVGEKVQTGQVLATVDEQDLGSPVHASVAGTVTLIDARGVHIS